MLTSHLVRGGAQGGLSDKMYQLQSLQVMCESLSILCDGCVDQLHTLYRCTENVWAGTGGLWDGICV